jgi:hypothetical protein
MTMGTDSTHTPGARVAPSAALFREVREAAGLSTANLARALAPRFSTSPRTMGVRLTTFERGRDRTIAADLYDAMREEVVGAFDDPAGASLAHRLLADDLLTADVRLALARFRELEGERLRDIAAAEEALASLRPGLDAVRSSIGTYEAMLAEREQASRALRADLG